MNLVSGLPILTNSQLGEFYSTNKRDNVLTTVPSLEIHAYPQREKMASSAYVKNAKNEIRGRGKKANGGGCQESKFRVPFEETSLTHMGLKQGRKETHHEPHRWWTEAERAEKTSPGDCAGGGGGKAKAL